MRHVSEKQKERNKSKAQEAEELHTLFREIWDERECPDGTCYCFESGRALPGYVYRGNAGCYHHVLEKGKSSYPQYKNVKKNIIIIHPEIHQQVGKSIDNTPNIKKYREYLLSLHQEGKLKNEENG